METETLFAHHGSEKETLEEAYQQVVQAVQNLVSHPSNREEEAK